MRLRGEWIFRIWLAVIVLWFSARAVLVDPSVKAGFFGEDMAYLIGGPSKLAAFMVGTFYAWRASRAFEAGNPSASHWRNLSLGLGSFCLGQAVLVAHQLILPGSTPFPSLADPCFLLGYPFLVTGLLGFIRTYAFSGLELISKPALARISIISTVLFAGLALIALRPIFSDAEATATELLVSAGYPLLDCVLLVPTIVLVRMMYSLRGGKMLGPWLRILLGILAFTIGDVAFALDAILDVSQLDAVLDLGFAGGYLLTAWGCYRQCVLMCE